ncbi:glucose-1-phosphate adenylyltransferase [Virgibacillus necropolis]|uniref:Glucose-1-phosphate adenylyltransferase n=1 Tax=Virgibacillus necropolis TaxID=163877 RepID=A0A221MGE2_9BACI|nr:glucose-1-phosphate adenylyltransferase [Virgibacillus necropolis]ASN06726.1 glucose-1-phosphate adenylyltransferase [Virgibacillus necropolis]
MKECVGMLLAGGEGKRLGALTKDLAKPAVHFGGKYRIIDFTLSNCTNSGIQTVGVMTQYSPLELNKHIGTGGPWDLNRQHGGATVLSPYTGKDGGDWYSGTADAIYQNIHFIDQHDPEYILVISGDHIYQMDYSTLLHHHKQTKADATISVIPVPWDEASRFGILNTTDDMRIYEFDEKPENPKNDLASMGIYIFTWSTLKSYLLEDAANIYSSHDFGKDIIPAMVNDDLRLFAYRFEGYWKDVGTIQSYWEANMDLLDEDLQLSLNNKNWRIYSNESNFPPQYFGETAVVKHSLINSGCWVSGTVNCSVLFENVEIKQDSEIYQSILHPGVTVDKNVILERVIVMGNTTIPEGTCIQVGKEEEPLVIDQKSLASILA